MTRQAPTPPPTLAPDADLASLQAQLGQLQVQLAGVTAQWNGLKDQLDQMLRNNPARPRVQQQWADVGMQKAKIEGDVALLQARIAQKLGRPITPPAATPTLPGFPRFYVAPNVAVPAMSVVTLVLLFPLSIAWAKRIMRRARASAPASPDLTMRLDRIEQAVDTIAIEVERISEGQRFVTKIMAERASPANSNDSPAAAQVKQPLALGAGAMEPIVVPERERVRQRVITPH
jgi:hypothetical protein